MNARRLAAIAPQMSESGTNRTNRAGLAMSVHRVDRTPRVRCGIDAIDPTRTLLAVSLDPTTDI
jgi:hypothetical protein